MRSRTELVTTTFIDSEEDPTESDDSEEDWRPTQSAKRRLAKPVKPRRKRRKLSFPAQTTFKEAFRRQHKSGSLGKPSGYFAPRPSTAEQKLLLEKLNAEQNIAGKTEPFDLYLYKKDLDQNYKENSHLCLWRRDNMNLLQKYIRVKTSNPEEFIFTSSSVYSSWDDKRRRDFVMISVKHMEENNRRVTLLNSADLLNLVNEAVAYRSKSSNETHEQGEESSNNEASNYEYENEEGEEEDEIDEEDDDDESYEDSTDEENNQSEQHFEDEAQNAQSDSSDSTNPIQ